MIFSFSGSRCGKGSTSHHGCCTCTSTHTKTHAYAHTRTHTHTHTHTHSHCGKSCSVHRWCRTFTSVAGARASCRRAFLVLKKSMNSRWTFSKTHAVTYVSCVTWLILCVCDLKHLCVAWLIHVWHDSFMCEVKKEEWARDGLFFSTRTLWDVCNVWHEVFVCDKTHCYEAWYRNVCPMTDSYVILKISLIHVWYDSSMCDMSRC